MEERDNTNENIVYPLPYGLKTFITRELSKITQDIDESITIIENTVKENNNLYVSLIQNLHDILKDDTKPFVNKIIQYKKRICRDGVTCKRGINCIFNHPTKTYEPFNKAKTYEPFNKTKTYEPYNKTKTYEPYNKTKPYENYSKRPRFTDNTELNEIIINNVPLHITDDEVKNYCDQFGFCTVKRLKENKFLISYKTNEGAKGLLYAKETMFNDDGVKKYFNRNTKVQEDDLEQLFEDLDYQINYVRNETNHEGFKKMNWIMNRIKSIVLKKTNVREKKSLLCNSNFVME